mmetsp:Transcript_21524/g.81930  ORF Transcript_21524/g.81930 Transcript_21524/m.81930 type:complete len:387 (+) Transcript_21524:1682-2842(+)
MRLFAGRCVSEPRPDQKSVNASRGAERCLLCCARARGRGRGGDAGTRAQPNTSVCAGLPRSATARWPTLATSALAGTSAHDPGREQTAPTLTSAESEPSSAERAAAAAAPGASASLAGDTGAPISQSADGARLSGWFAGSVPAGAESESRTRTRSPTVRASVAAAPPPAGATAAAQWTTTAACFGAEGRSRCFAMTSTVGEVHAAGSPPPPRHLTRSSPTGTLSCVGRHPSACHRATSTPSSSPGSSKRVPRSRPQAGPLSPPEASSLRMRAPRTCAVGANCGSPTRASVALVRLRSESRSITSRPLDASAGSKQPSAASRPAALSAGVPRGVPAAAAAAAAAPAAGAAGLAGPASRSAIALSATPGWTGCARTGVTARGSSTGNL